MSRSDGDVHVIAAADAPDAAARFSHAVALMKLGRCPEALQAFDEVLRLEPDHVPSLVNRGIVLERLDRPAEAMASYDAALSINPVDPFALNNRGEALQKLMRPDDAIASFRRALALAPELWAVGFLSAARGSTETFSCFTVTCVTIRRTLEGDAGR